MERRYKVRSARSCVAGGREKGREGDSCTGSVPTGTPMQESRANWWLMSPKTSCGENKQDTQEEGVFISESQMVVVYVGRVVAW